MNKLFFQFSSLYELDGVNPSTHPVTGQRFESKEL